jgi:DNA polymerase III alpha subunit (gram-positive type)
MPESSAIDTQQKKQLNTDKVKSKFAQRFRGYFPVVIDVETAGFNSQTDALLELAASVLHVDEMLRMVDALQFHQDHGEVCPAGWNKGDKGMTASPEGVAAYLTDNAEQL